MAIVETKVTNINLYIKYFYSEAQEQILKLKHNTCINIF